MAHFDDTLEPIGFTVDSGDGAGCPCPPHPPCPPPFPPPAPKPSAVDDNVPYNPATFADLCKVRMEIVTEAMERINYDKYLSSEISKLTPGGRIDVDDHLSLTSTNPVQNKIITRALQEVTIPIDSILSVTSTNPVQNKVITETLIDIDEDIETVSGDVFALNERVEELSVEISGQRGRFSILSSKVTELGGDISELSGSCLNIEECVSSLSGDVDTLRREVVILSSDIDSISGELDNITYNINALDLRCLDIETGVGELSALSEVHNNHISILSSDIKDLFHNEIEISGFVTEHDVRLRTISSEIEQVEGTVSSLSGSCNDIKGDVLLLSSSVGVLIGDSELHDEQILNLSSDINRVEDKSDALDDWCDGEFVKDEFTDFMDIDIHKEIRGGYSDDDILLIGTKGGGLHYMLPGDAVPSKCKCPVGQEEFNKYQFRNIIKGNGCYVATNRDSSNRTNIYTSVDGVTWDKKEHTLKHVDTNGNVCYSDVSHKYYHATFASEYPELSSTGNCIEVSDDLENWSVLTLADDRKIIGTYGYASVMCAGKYLYITTIGVNAPKTRWYISIDLTTNLVHNEGDKIFHGYNLEYGWMRWVEGDRIYIGCSQSGVEYSDRIITTADGFDTFDEYVINPGNKLGFDFPSSSKMLIIRSMAKYKGVYYIGTYESASPHILMSYDLKYWHVVSTPEYGIGADMLCPFSGILYVGYSGDASEVTGTALMADVRYTYHTDRIVTNSILNDLEKGGTGGGGSLAKVEKINVPYNDKIVRAKVNEIIVALGGTIDPIPDEFTDEDIKERVNQIIDKYS